MKENEIKNNFTLNNNIPERNNSNDEIESTKA